ncbi:MAG: endonuclease/exonuclease/phosphatase family protein [Defluviitaleaceae bacterium]|nr:endonuclease/exonuclease/phosphatase family protein [Defluviitaleaceae bacterium]
MILRFGTYNVRNTDGGASLRGIAEEIKSLNLDIVGLQEIDVGTNRVGGRNTIAELAVHSDMPFLYFYPSMRFDGGFYGNAVLSRHKIESAHGTVFQTKKYEKRSILSCTVVLEEIGKEIVVHGTHLSLEDGDIRRNQLLWINEYVQGDDFVILGDFNVNSMDEYSLVEKSICANNADSPIDTFKSGGAIDNIIVSDNLGIKSVFLSETEFSDHNMLVAEIVIK